MSKTPLDYLAHELASLEKQNLLRERPREGAPVAALELCSNDYLGYRATGRLLEHAVRAAREHPAGAGASRLVTGDHPAHRHLETALADWLRTEETLVFTSGYACNVGTIAALAGEGDVIVSDALNHASIIDGCRLSRARVVVVPHLAIDEVRRALLAHGGRRRWVVTESYFSMDGDGPDLRALRGICDETGAALILDEAHALGVFGPEGRGRAAEAGVQPDVMVGTLGKALATQGAFVAGSGDLCRWLWNRARSLVFSTGLSPMLASVAAEAVREIRGDQTGRDRLSALSDDLRRRLNDLGIPVANRSGPILPIVLGSEHRALAWRDALGERGVKVQAIRPPTVPNGTSRLRVTTRASLGPRDMELAVSAFGALVGLDPSDS